MSKKNEYFESGPAYFAYSLPKDLPYVEPGKRQEFHEMFARIAARMDKLENALDITGLDGATFAEYAKVLFDTRFDRFEGMTPEMLADYVLTVHDGKYQAKKRVEWPNADVVVDSAFTTTKEWEAIRHIGIGGSDAAVVLGISPYKSPYQLYHDKRCTPQKIPEDTSRQVIFDRGHAVEARVVEAFCKMVGAEIIPETRMFRSKDNPFSIADVDAVVKFPGKEDCYYIFEAKSTVADNADAWLGGRIPPHYVPQTRQYPAVLKDPRIKGCYIGCLFVYDYTIHGMYVDSGYDVGRFVSRLVERDENEEQMVLQAESAFFEKNILTGQVPQFEGKPENDIKSMRPFVGYADKDAEVIELDGSYEKAIRDYLALAEKKSAIDAQSMVLKEAMQAISMPLIETLGTSVEARLPVPDSKDHEYFEVKYSPRRSTSVDFDVLEHKYPDVYDECVTNNPDAFRVFGIKVKKPKAAKKKSA